jgi:hypothetical protein
MTQADFECRPAMGELPSTVRAPISCQSQMAQSCDLMGIKLSSANHRAMAILANAPENISR